MRLYHYTHRSRGDRILRFGFQNSDAIPSLGIPAGVWLTDVPTKLATTHRPEDGGRMLAVDVPDEWAARFLVDGAPGEYRDPGWREFCIPATLLNGRPGRSPAKVLFKVPI